MREIKFRAWDKVYKKMIYSPMAMTSDWVLFTAEVENESCHNAIHPIQQYEIMQYTGLKDCKGTEIYEGDIVFHGGHGINFEVVWCDGKGEFLGNQIGWMLTSKVWDRSVALEACLGSMDVNKEEYFEGGVLGNIYEHPELLR